MKLITKVILLIVSLMTPVIALYTYSNKQSTDLVEEQITIANQNRLAIFMHQIEGTMEQVSQYSNLIAQDPDFAQLAGNVIPENGYDYAVLLEALQSKLRLFSISTAWMNRINLYFPNSGHAISSYSLIPYDADYLINNLTAQWSFRTIQLNGITNQAFTRFFVEPASAAADVTHASIVVEVNLMGDNIVSQLDSFKTKGNNDPFLYKGANEYLLNGSADEPFIKQLIATGTIAEIDPSKGYKIVSIQGKRYLLYGLTSPILNWTLVDYIPLETILKPVTDSRNLFYLTAGLLVLMGAAAAYLIYSQVQVPIRQLGYSVDKLERGELSTRISNASNRDFYQLFRRFNRMAGRMQHLIEKVYQEELRTKEAVMKQLQSQINPHFLYNSLAYIVSMAQLKRVDPVISMAYSLADYYRYTTRTDKLDTTIQDEIAFVVSYIEIMDMQLAKVRFQVDIPDELEQLEIPKLLFQPIVENAILHGLEPKMGSGMLRILGWTADGFIWFRVEDDGVGMADEAIHRMNEALSMPQAADTGFGLWNVHQRMQLRFGPSAGIAIARSETGGIEVVLKWPAVPKEEV